MADSIIDTLLGRSGDTMRKRQEAFKQKQREEAQPELKTEEDFRKEWEAAPGPGSSTEVLATPEEVDAQLAAQGLGPASVEQPVAPIEEIEPTPEPTLQPVTETTQITTKRPTQEFRTAQERRAALIQDQQALAEQIRLGELANDERSARFLQDINVELSQLDQQANQEIEDLQKSVVAERADIEEKRQQLAQLKPEQFWAKQDTSDKIKIGLGLLLGAIGQGLTGSKRNAALTTLQNAINQDLDIFNKSIDRRLDALNRSDAALDKKQSMIRNLENLRDARTKATLDRLNRQLDVFGLQTKNQNALATIQQLKNQIEQEHNKAQLAEEQKLTEVVQTSQTAKQAQGASFKDKSGLTKPGFTDQGKAQTSEQLKAEAFANRIKSANEVLITKTPPPSAILRANEALGRLEDIPVIGDLVGAFRPAIGQTEADLFKGHGEYLNAMRDFIGAKLRKESGAAIATSEFVKEAKLYFPEPGDTPAVLNQKARAREQVLRNARIETGRNIGRAN